MSSCITAYALEAGPLRTTVFHLPTPLAEDSLKDWSAKTLTGSISIKKRAVSKSLIMVLLLDSLVKYVLSRWSGRKSIFVHLTMDLTMSKAFAPHVSQVLAIDDSRGMVDQYNKNAAKSKTKHPGCDMRAVYGDLIDRFDLRPALDPRITDPEGEYQSFDLVMMCASYPTPGRPISSSTEYNLMIYLNAQQTIDSYLTSYHSSKIVASMELVKALNVLAGGVKDGGVLVIVDIEKFYGDAEPDEALLDGRKETGSGSREVTRLYS